jgi:hypothetical protein
MRRLPLLLTFFMPEASATAANALRNMSVTVVSRSAASFLSLSRVSLFDDTRAGAHESKSRSRSSSLSRTAYFLTAPDVHPEGEHAFLCSGSSPAKGCARFRVKIRRGLQRGLRRIEFSGSTAASHERPSRPGIRTGIAAILAIDARNGT